MLRVPRDVSGSKKSSRSSKHDPESNLSTRLRRHIQRIVKSPVYIKTKDVLAMGKELSEALSSARDGGLTGKILAAGTAGSVIMENLAKLSEPGSGDYWTLLNDLGYEYERISDDVMKIIADTFLRANLEKFESKVDDHQLLIEWPGLLAGIWDIDENSWEMGPYFHIDGKDRALEHVRQTIWSANLDLLLGLQAQSRHEFNYTLDTIQPASDYVGEPDPARLYKRFSKGTANNVSRFIMIMGPTGSGKSTLARLVSYQLRPGAGVMKVTNPFLKQARDKDLVDLISFLRPGVVLLDDVHSFFKNEEKMLSLLESCHNQGILMVGTYMDDNLINKTENTLENGSLYHPGMRPGRVDELIIILSPDALQRRKVLEYYAKGEIEITDDMVSLTEGLTNAYLREFAFRLRQHGPDEWQQELRSLRLFAPSFESDSDDDDIGEV